MATTDELFGRDAIKVFRGTLNIDTVPEVNDTLTVGDRTYTFVAAADADSDLEIAIGQLGVFLNTLTVDTQPLVGETMTVGGRTYTFVADGDADSDLEISVGTDLASAQANIVAAINGADGVNEQHPTTIATEFIEDRSLFAADVAGVMTAATFSAGTNVFENSALIEDAELDVEAVRVKLAATQANIVDAINGADTFNTPHPIVTAAPFSGNVSTFSTTVANVAPATSMASTPTNGFFAAALPLVFTSTLRWEINGLNQGRVSNLEFEGFENLTGSDSNDDLFVLEPGAALTGLVTGGSGGLDTFYIDKNKFDSAVINDASGDGDVELTVNSGTPSSTISYAGMERPSLSIVDDGDGNFTWFGDSTRDVLTLTQDSDPTKLRLSGEDVWRDVDESFPIPTKSLTINLGGGFDKITLSNLRLETGASLTIDGDGKDKFGSETVAGDYFSNLVPFLDTGDEIIVEDNATVSTQGLTGGAGQIAFTAEKITIGAGAQLLAKVDLDGGNVNSADIRLRAKDIGIAELENLSPFTVNNIKRATIDIGAGAVIDGQNLIIKAQAEDKSLASVLGAPALVDTFVIQPLLEFVKAKLALPIKVLIKKSVASVTLGEGAQLTGTAGVSAEAVATTDSSGTAFSTFLSVGYAQATAEATVDVRTGVTINAGEALLIGADGNATAAIGTETSRGKDDKGPGKDAFSFAIANAHVTSHATVAEGATITAGKTANIVATGSKEASAEAKTGLYKGGRAGMAFGLGFSSADIKSEVLGTVTANMIPGSVVKLEFDPKAAEGNAGHVGTNAGLKDTIFVGSHALASGDKVNYSNRRGNSIGGDPNAGGLSGPIDGNDYFVITIPNIEGTAFDESQLIQLAQTEARALAVGDAWLKAAEDGTLTATEKQALEGSPQTAIELSSDVLGVATDDNSKEFTPDVVDNDDDTITLDNEAFTGTGTAAALLGSTFELGQAVRYDAVDGPTAAIGGLESGKVYYVMADTSEDNLQGDLRFVDKQVIRLAETENKARAGIYLEIDPSNATGTHTLTAYHVLDSGLTTGVGVRAELDSSDSVTATSGDDSDDSILEQAVTFLTTGTTKNTNSVAKGVFEKLLGGSAGKTSKLSLAGALAFNKVDNEVRANVGSLAVLKSGEDLEVVATISEQLQLNAESDTELADDGPRPQTKAAADSGKYAGSAAVIVGLYDNTAEATVSSGASLDAFRAMRVISDVSYPYLTRPDEFVPTTAGEARDVMQNEGFGGLSDYLDGTLGIKSKLFNTWARSTAKGKELSIAGSVNVLDFDNVSKATVESGVQINQDTAFLAGNLNHSVSVEATNYMQLMNLTGVFNFDLSIDSLKNAWKNKEVLQLPIRRVLAGREKWLWRRLLRDGHRQHHNGFRRQ